MFRVLVIIYVLRELVPFPLSNLHSTWTTKGYSLSGLYPSTNPARLNLPGTTVPAGIALGVTETHKLHYHGKVAALGEVFKNKLRLDAFNRLNRSYIQQLLNSHTLKHSQPLLCNNQHHENVLGCSINLKTHTKGFLLQTKMLKNNKQHHRKVLL